MKKTGQIIVITIMVCCFAGCAPSIRKFIPKPKQKINPMGLFITVGSQINSKEEKAYQKFINQTAEEFIISIFRQKGYEVIPLNSVIPDEDVVTRVPYMFWYINEHKIADYAFQNKCSTVLIVQYALNKFIFGSWLKVHKQEHCGIDAWLVDTQNAKALTEDHNVFKSRRSKFFEKYRKTKKNHNMEYMHAQYVEYITLRMFGNVFRLTAGAGKSRTLPYRPHYLQRDISADKQQK